MLAYTAPVYGCCCNFINFLAYCPISVQGSDLGFGYESIDVINSLVILWLPKTGTDSNYNGHQKEDQIKTQIKNFLGPLFSIFLEENY